MFFRSKKIIWLSLVLIFLTFCLSAPLWAGEILMSQAGFANWLQQATLPLQQKITGLHSRSDRLASSIKDLEKQIVQEIVLKPGVLQVSISGPVLNTTKTLDVAPVIKNDRTLVPLRFVGEILGAEVIWDDAARTVTYISDQRNITLKIDSKEAKVDGQTIALDVPPTIINSRTMVPLRFVGEWMGAVVRWDGATSTILIRYYSGN